MVGPAAAAAQYVVMDTDGECRKTEMYWALPQLDQTKLEDADSKFEGEQRQTGEPLEKANRVGRGVYTSLSPKVPWGYI